MRNPSTLLKMCSNPPIPNYLVCFRKACGHGVNLFATPTTRKYMSWKDTSMMANLLTVRSKKKSVYDFNAKHAY